jgi:hypothetical protein
MMNTVNELEEDTNKINNLKLAFNDLRKSTFCHLI